MVFILLAPAPDTVKHEAAWVVVKQMVAGAALADAATGLWCPRG